MKYYMFSDAIAKLQAEIDSSKNNSYVKAVGGFLKKYLEGNPEVAKQVLVEGKTIKGSLVEMKKEARKNQVDNCGILTDEEGFAVVLKYYGIAPAETLESKTTVPAPKGTDFDVKLDDFLD